MGERDKIGREGDGRGKRIRRRRRKNAKEREHRKTHINLKNLNTDNLFEELGFFDVSIPCTHFYTDMLVPFIHIIYTLECGTEKETDTEGEKENKNVLKTSKKQSVSVSRAVVNWEIIFLSNTHTHTHRKKNTNTQFLWILDIEA